MDSSRGLRRAIFAVVVSMTIAACSAATLSTSPAPSPSAVATVGAPTANPSATIPAAPSPSPAPETAAPSGSQSPARYPEMPIPANLIHTIPVPAGAEVVDPMWGEISAEGDWLATQFSFEGAALGHDKQLYAVNIATGTSRRLADHFALASVANGRVAWVDPTCGYHAPSALFGDVPSVCTAWALHLMDLATGSDRVVASGSVTEGVSDELEDIGDEQTVMPTAALSSDTLAYSTGDLKDGFRLHMLSISSGSERMVGLGGMIEEMSWAGNDLVWIEDTDLHHDNGGPHGADEPYYYTGTRLMLLQAGAEVATRIGSSPISFEADTTGIVWTDDQAAFYRASGPGWASAGLGPLPSFRTIEYSGYPIPVASVDFMSNVPLISISGGWLGWFVESGAGPTTGTDPYLVLPPQGSVPRVVPYGSYLSGGWLFLIPRDPATERPTGFEAVRIADLH